MSNSSALLTKLAAAAKLPQLYGTPSFLKNLKPKDLAAPAALGLGTAGAVGAAQSMGSPTVLPESPTPAEEPGYIDQLKGYAQSAQDYASENPWQAAGAATAGGLAGILLARLLRKKSRKYAAAAKLLPKLVNASGGPTPAAIGIGTAGAAGAGYGLDKLQRPAIQADKAMADSKVKALKKNLQRSQEVKAKLPGDQD